MTGLVFLTINPSSFWVTFVLAEIISLLSTLTMEDMHMVIKVLREVKSFVSAHSQEFIEVLECHLPYRFNLLMS